MSNKITFFGILGFVFLLAIPSWAQQPSAHTVFLIGDAGEPKLAEENLAVLKAQLEAVGENASLIFLGDNIYSDGLPTKDHPNREEREEKLRLQLEVTKNFKGKTVVIPGNHDWDKGGKLGWERVEEQTRYVNDYFGGKKVFYPKNGYPGPEEIKLDKGLYLIVFDMQWMLHKWEKTLEDNPLLKTEPIDILLDIASLLEKHKNHHVILASHHPVYSYGEHGGKFPFKAHLFPLTSFNKNFYLPLPIIGSLYPTYRATAGNIQDIPHPEYKAIRNVLEAYLKDYPNAIYVSGHEHSLQHIQKEGVNYIVSGSGSKHTYLKEDGKFLTYGKSRVGFGRVTYERKGKASVEFWAADQMAPKGELIYGSELYEYQAIKSEFANYPNYSFEDTVKKASASIQYNGTERKKRYMGINYRDVWAMEVEAPIFNLKETKGGLEILKKGGGMQTQSLRMEASDGKQYVLRSVEKYAQTALPHILQETFAVDVVQDQISASHPYGAFVVPPMAEAIGIYHTNPKLVFVPDDGAFGQYREAFANKLALFEERPNGDWSQDAFFGNSGDIVSTADVEEAMRADNDNQVDERFMLKNRMFDMIIGDWDRHQDQWRWASYDSAKGKLYRPIPRDRDQTFFKNEGVFPKIASRRWAMAKIEGFNPEVRWAPGFNFNARHLDRIFLNRMDRVDWEKTIARIQTDLTDEIIEEAIHQWPENVFAQSGESTIATLKSRRDNLEEYSLEFYESLAKKVDVLGTDKKELVLIQNLNKEQTQITVHKIDKKGDAKQIIYDRVFESSDTKEIRIYGFDGKDQFKMSGVEKNKINVRIIGGKGKDQIFDLTENKSAKNIKIYDRKSSTELITDQQDYKNRLSNRRDINSYNKYEFKYDVLMPIVYGSYNRDDGTFLGGGFMYTQHGWRKDPFASRHLVLADKALATGAFNIKYTGTYNNVFRKWNLQTVIDIKDPEVNNFFGIGNDSKYDVSRGIDYYRLRVEEHQYRVAINNEIGNTGAITFGLQYRSFGVEKNEGTFIASDGFDEFETDQLFDNKRIYGGFYSTIEFDTRDEKLFPSRGLFWQTEASAYNGWNENANEYAHFHTNLALVYSFQYPARVTLASRTGCAHNFGKFVKDEFYNANSLGGRSNLRGFRKTRFYGRTSFYQNVDLRVKVLDFSSLLFPGKLGVHGFYDIGRVWTATYSEQWHRSAGFGIWLAPLSKAAVSLSYAFSKEENLISFDFGFFF
jgi:hypothetical protein